MPPPMLAASLSLKDTAGLMLTVLTSDSTPWKRPIQFESYLVASPNGTLTPNPKFNLGPASMAKKKLGTSLLSPASPPVPLNAGLLSAAGWLAPLLNFVEGTMYVPANATCLPAPRRAMPAGFHHTVVASSATAAAPA